MNPLRAFCLGAAVWLLVLCPIFAAPGDLDPSFGTGGKVTTALGTSTDEGYTVALQDDGKIVVAGYSENGPFFSFAVVRYQPDGSLDTSFGRGGKAITRVGNDTAIANCVAVQPDGKIVVAGYSQTGTNQDFAVVRYTSTGALDTTFNGTGIVITPVGSGNDQALGIALQDDGKILVTGFANNGTDFDFATVRYTSAGTLDPTFNSTGIVMTTVGASTDLAYSVVVQPDGKVVVGGAAVVASDFEFAVVRYMDTGALDIGFGGTGVVTTAMTASTDTGRSLALQSDGKIVLVGFSQVGLNQAFSLARYETDGDLDLTFGSGTGKVVDASIGPSDDFAVAAALQGDGKILVAGSSSDGGGNSDFALARFTSAGVLDTSFNGTGFVTTSFGSFNDAGNGMAVQKDGRIVVAGSSQNGSNQDFALARYEAFAPADLDSLSLNISGTSMEAIAVQPDGKTIIAGSFSSVLGQSRQNIARINADGTLDTAFDPATNGAVFCVVVQADGKIVLGGNFTMLQPNGAPAPAQRNFIARLNADGTLDAGFDPNANSIVRTIAQQRDGKLLIGGNFTTLQPPGAGTPISRSHIARLAADGAIDANFNPTPDSVVQSIAVQPDDKVLLAGNFANLSPNGAGATSRNFIARVNADGLLDTSFDPNANGAVFCLALQRDGKVLLGGSFQMLQPNAAPSATRNRVARLNSDGTVDPGFDPNADNDVRSLAVQADGRVLLAGDFTALQPNGAVSPTTRNFIARLNDDGTLDAGFDPNPNAAVSGVALQADGRVLLGGSFASLQPNGVIVSTMRDRFARLYNDSAPQTLSMPDLSQVLWTRDDAAPEVEQVTFDVSTDGGANWAPLGEGVRVGATANWQLDGAALPDAGLIRVRGRASGGYSSASSGFVEQVLEYLIQAAVTPIIATGGNVTAPDLPGNTTFLDFTAPDIGVTGGRILTDDGRKLAAVFNEQGVVLLHGQQMVPIDPGGGPDMGTIAKLQPPTGDAVLATLAPGIGVAKANDQVLFTGLLSDDPQPAVREGQDVPESPDTALQSFVSVDGNGSATFFLARLRAKSPVGKGGVGLFAVGPAPTGAHLLVQTGQMIGVKKVKVIATLVGQAGSLAEGRWRGGQDRIGVRLTFTDKSQALYSMPATANGPGDWLLIAQKGDDAAPDLTGAKLFSFQLPAYAPDAAIFDSLLQKGPAGITRKNSRAIFDAQGVDVGGPITLRLLAQVAGPAPALSNFQRFLNTLAGQGRASTIIGNATLNGGASRGTIFDARQDGVLRPIARLGENAPGGGRFDRFVSVAKPDGQGYGALVSALLKASKPDGVTSKNRAALYAVDSKGDLRRVLRAGDQVESAGPGSALKPVKSFVALTAASGSIGAARGYDSNGRVNALVTFTDRTQAVVSIQVP